MMKKQYLSIPLACITVLVVLSGCAESHMHQLSDTCTESHMHQPSDTCAESHIHQPSDTWEVDADKHWKSCMDCEQILDEGVHTLDDIDICTVCGAQVLDWGDRKSVYRNESKNLMRVVDYDADGNILTETIHQYEYDTDGNLTRFSITTDGVLTEESIFTIVDGESVISQYVSYMDDGSKCVNEYDNGNVIRELCYDADGNLKQQRN